MVLYNVSMCAFIVRRDGTISSAAKEIFTLVGASDVYDAASANTYAQQNFLRKEGSERWQMSVSQWESKRASTRKSVR